MSVYACNRSDIGLRLDVVLAIFVLVCFVRIHFDDCSKLERSLAGVFVWFPLVCDTLAGLFTPAQTARL